MTAIAPPSGSATPSRRADLVDLARGLALVAMFVFHFTWDLSLFRLIATDIAAEPGWRWFARCIAGSFLVIVGFSLVLATRNGFKARPYFRRLAMVAGAAALVTLATWFALPDAYIFFGILHHVAVASVLGLVFLQLPILAVAGAAVTAFALPPLVASPLLDSPWLAWLGLGRQQLSTADYVPVLPWFGCVLAGIVLARLVLGSRLGARIMGWRAASAPTRLLAWGGRHSLAVYLVHQPVFFAVLFLAARVAAMPAADARPFVAACERSCAASGQAAATCRPACLCTVDRLKRAQLWDRVLADRLSADERTRMSEIVEGCYDELR